MPTDPDLIFDVGMHRAEDTAFYLAKGFRVVAVEANADLCDLARDRFADALADGQLIIENVAIADKPGPIEFYKNGLTEWGTTNSTWAKRNESLGSPTLDVTTVKGVTFSSLLERHGVPHFLKIDIEGADFLCLEGLSTVDSRPQYLSIESDKRRWRGGILKEFNMLRSLGYDRFKVVDQLCVPQQTPPVPSREGLQVDHTFPLGASGLFGAELPGVWLSRNRSLAQYAVIFMRYWFFGDYGILRARDGFWGRPGHVIQRFFGRVPWFDTHATLNPSP